MIKNLRLVEYLAVIIRGFAAILLALGFLAGEAPLYSQGKEPTHTFGRLRSEFEYVKTVLPPNFPKEEVDRMEAWMQEYNPKSRAEEAILLEKLSAQIEYIKALTKKVESENEIKRVNGEIERVKKEITELEETNLKVMQEIKKIEQR